MDITHIHTIVQIQKFLKNNVEKFSTKEKRLVQKFIRTVTGYSHVHLKRLISKHKKGQLQWIKWQKETFTQVYTNEAIALLHITDEAHQLSGVATKKILEREYHQFKNKKYRKLANISVSHIYNLRNLQREPIYI